MGVSGDSFIGELARFPLGRLAVWFGVISLWNYGLVVVFQDVPLKE
jgi:hypothetical protein